jgi:hypothetical protein
MRARPGIAKKIKKAKKSKGVIRRAVSVEEFRVLVEALHGIAQWGEGALAGLRAEPVSAEAARRALARVGVHGPPKAKP